MVTPSFLSKMHTLLLALLLSTALSKPQRALAATPQPPNAVHEERQALLAEPTLERESVYWASMGAHGSFYDGDLEMLLGRAGVAYSMGFRKERFGLLSSFQFDSFWDFGQQISRISTISAALGGEMLFVHGRIRTALTIGVTALLNKTALVNAGHVG